MYESKPKGYVPNFHSLDKLVEEKFLRKSISPCGRLVLYGYTDHCTYNRKWNKHTLNARGSVYEISTGKLIAKAFPKFFNFEELPVSRSRNLMKQKNFSTFEKADGSLGILYKYDGQQMANTRGSFNSDQAIEALQMAKEQYDLSSVPVYITLMAEIIYPENKIIMDYGDERMLILLGGYNVYSGEELKWDEIVKISQKTGMPIPEKYEFESIDALIDVQKGLDRYTEGFVVRFNNGERVKFKSKEYLKLARLMSYMTPLNFWEHMKNGKVDAEMLETIPEELREESDRLVKAMERSYRSMSASVYSECSEVLEATKEFENRKVNVRRREIGRMIKGCKNYKHAQCAFNVLDGKTEAVEKYIMKQIRPKGNEINIEEIFAD